MNLDPQPSVGTRRILYVTGTRADFGLMLPTLRAIAATDDLDLSIAVTGMHLSSRFGDTGNEVRASGLRIAAEIPVSINDDSGIGMARVATEVANGIVRLIAETRFDLMLLLGDRAEMLAAAMPAMLAGIPIAHLCGGDVSGTVDDPMRHAITRLAHLHLVATDGARERIERMGEEPWRITKVGAPGLVGLAQLADVDRDKLMASLGLSLARPVVALLFHPVVQDAATAGNQVQAILDALALHDVQIIALMPNADAGRTQIAERVAAFVAQRPADRIVFDHLIRSRYVSLLAAADVVVGNSSSGIIETATFGTPTINVGDRQIGRERNSNTRDVAIDRDLIAQAISDALANRIRSKINLYGDGSTDRQVVNLLRTINLSDPKLLKKSLTY